MSSTLVMMIISTSMQCCFFSPHVAYLLQNLTESFPSFLLLVIFEYSCTFCRFLSFINRFLSRSPPPIFLIYYLPYVSLLIYLIFLEFILCNTNILCLMLSRILLIIFFIVLSQVIYYFNNFLFHFMYHCMKYDTRLASYR